MTAICHQAGCCKAQKKAMFWSAWRPCAAMLSGTSPARIPIYNMVSAMPSAATMPQNARTAPARFCASHRMPSATKYDRKG